MLHITDLQVSYGRTPALRGVGLEVKAGEAVFVVGPNGAGKSTLLKTLAGLLKPATGAILFEGTSIAGSAPEQLCREGLVLVPEGRHIFGTLSVRENLQLALTVRKDRAEAQQDLDWVLELFPRLRERYRSAAGYLSGGEQQQLAISRALLQRPRLMLIDEPSLGLAPLVIDQVYGTLKSLKERGITLLIVEQNTARLSDLADRVHVLRGGRIAATLDDFSEAGEAALHAAYFGH